MYVYESDLITNKTTWTHWADIETLAIFVEDNNIDKYKLQEER